MKKTRVVLLAMLLICILGQASYGETYQEIKERFGIDVYQNEMTKEERSIFRKSDTMKSYNKELGKYIRYDSFSTMTFQKAGYDEKSLERAVYLGFDKKMKEQCKESEMYNLTRGNALRYIFIFSGYDTKPYENLFQDKNLVTWEEAEEMVKRIKPFVWNKEFENKEMWSDEEFIDYVNNNPDAHHFITTEKFKLDGKNIICIDKDEDKEYLLKDSIKTIPDANERVFQMLKILSFHAVKEGGTASFTVDKAFETCTVGIFGEHMDARAYGAENFSITVKNIPWDYKNIGTQITFDFFRLYKSDRYHYSGGRWTGIYPEILRSCMKELYREYYSDELFEYLKYIRCDSVLEMSEEAEKVINGIYVYYRGEDKRKFVMTKIK
ncbi:MAG: hypothetical protein N4A40_02975 [Tissierellales bacterium]|jgi:hypothetical protein|nr:hypothetical protein [Tissierellales bacterium]